MWLVRRRTLILKNVDIARVRAAVLRAVDAHRPSRSDIRSDGETCRVTFRTWVFDARAGGNWGLRYAVSRGWVDIKPLSSVEAGGVQVTSTLFVGRLMFMAALPMGFFILVMTLSGWWLAAGTALFVLPIWAAIFADGYAGSFQRSIQKALNDNERRRGFEVL